MSKNESRNKNKPSNSITVNKRAYWGEKDKEVKQTYINKQTLRMLLRIRQFGVSSTHLLGEEPDLDERLLQL